MNYYKLTFWARPVGALGERQYYTNVIAAGKDYDEARASLYSEFEHITVNYWTKWNEVKA